MVRGLRAVKQCRSSVQKAEFMSGLSEVLMAGVTEERRPWINLWDSLGTELGTGRKAARTGLQGF